MSADLKPYPAMKDSGVPWLGEVPAHWEVLRTVIGRSCDVTRSGSAPIFTLLSVVREQGVILRDTTSTDREPQLHSRWT